MPEPVTAERILAELHKYWASLASTTGPAQTHGVLRACAMTLVVLADETDEKARIAETLGAVMRDHPHRAIVVQVRPGAELGFAVAAQCWLAFDQRQQVCCEQIELTAAPEDLGELLPIIGPLAAPDLPVVVWCRSPKLADAALEAAPGKVIFDSYGFPDAASGLEVVARRPRTADLGWTRVTRWREVVAQVFADPARAELLPGLDSVRVMHSDPHTPSTAYYLAGWVEASLGRDLKASFEAVPQVLGGIEGLALTGSGHNLSMRLVDGAAVLIEIDHLKNCTVCPRYSEAELLSRELAVMGRDPVFEKALPRALRLARGR